MSTSIDSLNIQITANATSASRAIDNLVGKLDRLSASLNRINGSSLNGLANGVQRLGTAMQTMNNVRASDFTRLARNLTALGNVNTASLNSAASSMSHLTRAFNNLGGVSANATQVGELARNISRLGGANVQRAITNLPQLATALNNLMTTLSRAPRVSQNLIQMTNALANLASQGNRVGSASNMLVTGLNRTHTAARRTSKSMTSLASAFGRFYANFFLLVRGIKALGRSIESTGDYTEAFNYYTVTFGKIASKWDENWANYGDENARNYGNAFVTEMNDTFKKLSGVSYDPKTGLLSETGLKNLGLNIKDVTEYAAQLASMMDAVGHSGEVTVATTKAFTKLAADISSLTNQDYTEVGAKIRSVLQGQSRAGYGFGWDTTMASLQAMADKLDLSKAVSEMTQMEKQQLRILTILDQSTVAWRDQSNTINTFANQVRLLKNNFSEAGMMLGQLFIPLLAKILPFLNGLLIALKRLFGFLASFLNLDLGDTGQGFLDLEEDIDGVGDSLDDATDSAKKFKKQLAGFDELENLSSETGKSKLGVGGTGIDLTSEILKATEAYEKAFDEAFERMENKAQDWADRIVEFFTTGNVPAKISKALTDALNSIDWDSIYAFARDFGAGLADALNSFITPDLFSAVGQTIAGLLNTSIYQALSFAENFDWENFGLSIASGINNFFDTFDFGALAESLNRWVGGLWTAIKTAIFGDESGEGGIDFGKIFTGIGEFVASLEPLTAFVLLITSAVPVVNIFSTAMAGLSPIFTMLSSAVGAVNTVFSAFSGFIASASAPVLILVGAISALVIGLTDAYVKNEDVRKSFAQAVDLIAQNFAPALQLVTKTIIPDLQKGWQRIVEILKPFGDFLSGVFVSIWQDMINPALSYVGSTILPTLITTFNNLWTKILVPFGNFLGNVFSPIIKIISELFEMFWKNIIVPLGEQLGGTFSSSFEGVAGVLNNLIIPVVSGVIDIFNFLWTEVLTPLIDYIWDEFKPIFENVFNTIGDIIKGLQQTFSGLIDFITGVFSGDWAKAWEGIKDVFKGIMNGLIGIFEGIINNIVNGLNAFFSGFRNAVSSFGDIIGVDIEIPEIPNVELPRFEKGGFPQQYSLFMAGENGIPEIAGTVGGKTAVAGGAEITGIRQEIRATANEEMALLRQQNSLLQAILEKEFGISQDALFSSVRNSANDYHRRTGNFAFDI